MSFPADRALDDRAGGTARMPGNPWIFSRATLPPPGVAAFQGGA